ncbi:MAG: hypothetical protein JWO15_1780 [Sphingomonadales bacterium]|nr:hypothetical protein [Sphingomonadales bacterium]
MLGDDLLAPEHHSALHSNRQRLRGDQSTQCRKIGQFQGRGGNRKTFASMVKHRANGDPVGNHRNRRAKRTTDAFGLSEHVDRMMLSKHGSFGIRLTRCAGQWPYRDHQPGKKRAFFSKTFGKRVQEFALRVIVCA